MNKGSDSRVAESVSFSLRSSLKRSKTLRFPLRIHGLALFAALLLGGCGNMKDQKYLRVETPNALLRQSTSAQPPPPHTVAHVAQLPDAAFITGERNGQLVGEFPITVTPQLVARGQDRFTIYCAECHAPDGYGRGIIVQRGFPAPPSYHDPRLRNAPVGYLFRVITQGFGAMYPYADRLIPADRWAVVAYIRALQLSQHAKAKDLESNDRAELAHATIPKQSGEARLRADPAVAHSNGKRSGALSLEPMQP
jgi:mono/diheme cytochrome c family protein